MLACLSHLTAMGTRLWLINYFLGSVLNHKAKTKAGIYKIISKNQPLCVLRDIKESPSLTSSCPWNTGEVIKSAQHRMPATYCAEHAARKEVGPLLLWGN